MNNNSMKTIKEFKREIKNEYKNKSTNECYITDFNAFIKFLRIIEIEIVQINLKTVDEYKKYLIYNEISKQTYNRRILMAKKFFKYLYETNILSENYSMLIKVKGIKKEAENKISLKDYSKILQTLDISKMSDLKYALIFHILFKTTFNLNDIVNFKMKDIDKLSFDDKEIKSLLNQYIVEKSPKKYLFENKSGLPITRQSINKKLNQCLLKANLDKKITLASLKNAQKEMLSTMQKEV